MRIPPSIAQQIGALQNAARANDTVAATLEQSAELIAGALELSIADDLAAAHADATKAVELLTSIVSTSNVNIARPALAFAGDALTHARAGATHLAHARPDLAISALIKASNEAADGADAAETLAYDLRTQAEDLVAEYT